MTSCSRPSASCTTASALPVSGASVKTSSQVSGRPGRAASAVEVEVPRRALLEPQAGGLRRLLGELGGLPEQVLALGRRLGGLDRLLALGRRVLPRQVLGHGVVLALAHGLGAGRRL